MLDNYKCNRAFSADIRRLIRIFYKGYGYLAEQNLFCVYLKLPVLQSRLQ